MSSAAEHDERARRAIGANMLEEATAAVVALLEASPGDARARARLEEIFRAGGDGTPAFVPAPAQSMSVPAAAVRAYLLARAGRWDEGLTLLARSARATPAAGYERWGLALLAEVRPPTLGEGTSALLSAALALDPLDESGARATTMTALAAGRPPDAHLLWTEAVTARRRGELAKAATAAAAAHAVAPSWMTAIELAAIARDRGDIDEALAHYADALRRGGAATPIDMDVGDLLREAGRLDEAGAAYGRVLAREPGHPLALAALDDLGARRGDGAALDRLLVRADADPSQTYVEGLAQARARGLEPFVDHLPARDEASLQALRQVRRAPPPRPAPDARAAITITLSQLEPPSARTAWNLELAARGIEHLDVHFVVRQIQSPDPRSPMGTEGTTLWAYEGAVPSLAVARPPTEVVAAVGELAAMPYAQDAWWRRAGDVARDLGETGLRALPASMVWPEPPRRGLPAWTWLWRVQVAAAYVLARSSDGWQGTFRRRVLLGLARGQMDWTVDASLVALARIAREHADAAQEIHELFRSLLPTLATYRCYERALLFSYARLPDVDERERRELVERIRGLA